MTAPKKEPRYGIEVSMYDEAIDGNSTCFFGVGQQFTFKAPVDYCGIGVVCNYMPIDSTGEYGDFSEETLKDGCSYEVQDCGTDEAEDIVATGLDVHDEDSGHGSLHLGAINALFLVAMQMFMPPNALADEWTDPNTNYTWEYTVSYSGACLKKGPDAEGAITIPSELGGHSVTSIGKEAFKGCTNLVRICLPDGVKSIDIGNEAFAGCSSLKEINFHFPEDIYIGHEAFAGCSSFTEINFPKSIRSIGSRAFKKCVGLKSVQFNNVKGISLKGGAFADCSNLESVSFLGEGRVFLSPGVFSGCTNLRSITVNTNCSEILCWDKNRIVLRIISGKQEFEIHDFDFSRLYALGESREWAYIKNRIPYCNSGDELVSKFPATGICDAHPALYKDFCAGAIEAWCKQRETEMREKGERCDAEFGYDEKLGILTHVYVRFESPGVSVEALEAKYKNKPQRSFMGKLTSSKPRIVESTQHVGRTVYIDNDEVSVSGEIDSDLKVSAITIRSRKLDAALAERNRKEEAARAKQEAEAAAKKDAEALNF